MGQTEIKLFIILIGIVILVFIAGIIIFIFQYRHRRVVHDKEMALLNEKHNIQLLNTQLESQRQTMQFIGQEIHDSVAQKLTLASIYTHQLECEVNHEQLHKRLAPVSKILDDSLLELRQLSKNLTDPKLQSEDLAELIINECELINATGMCVARPYIEDVSDLTIPRKSSLLRIVQEFLQNSLKHSGCRQIIVKVTRQSAGLMIIMSDDGKGFVPGEVSHNGIGLDNIRRRIQHLGGKHSIKSEPGKGTTLEMSIPLILNRIAK